MTKLPVASRNCVNAPKNFSMNYLPTVGVACLTHSHTLHGRFTILHLLKTRRPATPLRRKMGQNYSKNSCQRRVYIHPGPPRKQASISDVGKEFSLLHSTKPGFGDHLNFSASGLPTRNMCVWKSCD